VQHKSKIKPEYNGLVVWIQKRQQHLRNFGLNSIQDI